MVIPRGGDPVSNACVLGRDETWRQRDVVHIDRRTPWGNPFKIGADGSRNAVLLDHEEWLRRQPELLNELWRLENRKLGCHCDPMPCHGWLLCYLANGTWEEVFDWHCGKPYWTAWRLAQRSRPGRPGWSIQSELDGL